MSKFHFLNVTSGDCHLIQHDSGRVSMIDICNGNASRAGSPTVENFVRAMRSSGVSGNFGICQHPTHPLDYLDSLGISSIWRFILTHPDMDHMDGLDELFKTKSIGCYWDSGVRREKPGFGDSRYKEADWDRYASIIAETNGTAVIHAKENARFNYANQPVTDHDSLSILSPNQTLVNEAGDSTNDASYLIVHHTPVGKILIPGDAHDKTWEHVIANHADEVRDCAILVAPHHGRDSDMDFSFLETVNPELVLMGCANSKDLAYDRYRDYNTITNNQAGNVVAETSNQGIDIFVQNETFAEAAGCDLNTRNAQGYVFYKSLV